MKRMKNCLMITLGLLIPAILAGCGAPGGGQDAAVSPAYELLEEESALPENILEAANALKEKKGYFVFDPQEFQTGEDTYLLIFSGEKPTGGYQIALESIEAHNNKLTIVVSETSPGEEDIVTQALTYPMLALKLDQTYGAYEVTGTDGSVFEPLEL